MPLEPKQQPPYYIPRTPGTYNAPIDKVNTQYIPVNTTTTTPVVVTDYIMPGNTISENGDIITMTYFGNAYNTPTNTDINVNILGNDLYTFNNGGNHYWKMNLEIIKYNDIAYYCIEFITTNSTNVISTGSLGSIDWTINQHLIITLTANTDGNIRSTGGFTTILKSR